MALPRYCSHCAAPLPGPPPVACPACDTSHWADAKPCAGALVTSDGALLLVRRAHPPWLGHWDVPGGFCGPREHPREAAVRELHEETGLVGRAGPIAGIWLDSYPDEPDSVKVTMNVYYHATVENLFAARCDPNEVSELAFFPADALPDEIAFPGHLREVLEAWREALASGELEEPLPVRLRRVRS